MLTACWIPKATSTFSQYVIFIAFPLQQWLHERVSLLRYTYIAVQLAYRVQLAVTPQSSAHTRSGMSAANKRNLSVKTKTSFYKFLPADTAIFFYFYFPDKAVAYAVR